MPRDYASQSRRAPVKGRKVQKGKKQKQKQSLRPSRRWLLLIVLVILAIAIAFAAVFFHAQRSRNRAAVVTTKQVDVIAAQPAIVNTHAKSSRQQRTVNIEFRPSRITAVSERPHHYELLVATVERLSQADEIRERLQRLKYKTELHQVEVGGNHRFRLEIGPFKSLGGAARAQSALQAQDIVTVIRAVH
ncbi:MAG: hypothetical protein GY821_05690 [Gammaproteobacteria bacterium]|nr:hypothetical protein [Gammaproteobacteria bacterium]